MATTRLIPMHKIKNQSIAYTVHERIKYAINPAKTLGGELVMTYGCDPATAANEMLLTKRAYADFTGRSRTAMCCCIKSGNLLSPVRLRRSRPSRSVTSWR